MFVAEFIIARFVNFCNPKKTVAVRKNSPVSCHRRVLQILSPERIAILRNHWHAVFLCASLHDSNGDGLRFLTCFSARTAAGSSEECALHECASWCAAHFFGSGSGNLPHHAVSQQSGTGIFKSLVNLITILCEFALVDAYSL